ncbi:MAG: MBL fold metallo-hydrolase, partial [Terrimonas ferruginea]|uniref:MBL fold metallo-hydrolase n=1 Tax=Terrimonas ferruginea TaxID=249 RepID=UPI001AC22508
PEKADILFIESTYGDRLHPKEPAMDILERIIIRAALKKGTIVIPSFAVERTQLLMYLFWQLKQKGRLPDIPIYMDSPMGKNVLEVFHKNGTWHKLSVDECSQMCDTIRRITTLEETTALINSKQPKIVIAGSGMATGGRVLSYFAKYLGDTNATVLLVGYQAEGTRGRALLEGAKEVKLYGKYFAVRAAIENIEGLSGHADQQELIEWLQELKQQPEKIFIVHGEPTSAKALRDKVKEVYGWACEIPALNDTITINE